MAHTAQQGSSSTTITSKLLRKGQGEEGPSKKQYYLPKRACQLAHIAL